MCWKPFDNKKGKTMRSLSMYLLALITAVLFGLSSAEARETQPRAPKATKVSTAKAAKSGTRKIAVTKPNRVAKKRVAKRAAPRPTAIAAASAGSTGFQGDGSLSFAGNLHQVSLGTDGTAVAAWRSTKSVAGVGPRPKRWCGWWMRTQRGGGPEFNLARNWAKYGRSTAPQVGAVVVWRSHVGEIVGQAGSGQWLIRSGNDGGQVRTRVWSLKGAVFRI
jgi:hypothetical protein